MTRSQLRLIELMKEKIATATHGGKKDHWVPSESDLSNMPIADMHKNFLGWQCEVVRLQQIIRDIEVELDALE